MYAKVVIRGTYERATDTITYSSGLSFPLNYVEQAKVQGEDALFNSEEG